MSKCVANPDPPVRVAIAVIVHNGHALIGHRPPGVRLAGYWEFPGGKLEPGETAAQCAVREVREECGLEVRISRELPAILRADHDLTVELLPFVCEIGASSASSVSSQTAAPDPPSVRAQGTTQLQWVPINRLREYRFPPANDELLVHIERVLGARA